MTAIRPGQPDDAADLARVFVAAWRHGYSGIVPDDIIDRLDERERAQWLAGRLADTFLATAVACAPDGRVTGFVRFGADPERPDHDELGYIAALYVDPEASGAGVGQALLGHAVEELHTAGRQTVSLWVFRDNERARRLYEQAGFTPAGIEVVDPEWRVPQLRYIMPSPSEPATKRGQ